MTEQEYKMAFPLLIKNSITYDMWCGNEMIKHTHTISADYIANGYGEITTDEDLQEWYYYGNKVLMNNQNEPVFCNVTLNKRYCIDSIIVGNNITFHKGFKNCINIYKLDITDVRNKPKTEIERYDFDLIESALKKQRDDTLVMKYIRDFLKRYISNGREGYFI